ncbi:hypothetical protein NVP1015O_02 [Vibrio phage 1.015.O._10N.222.51.E5]|nr:hypothetical protein NVP1015O_02 [Vibrio phage 1.015.O._10N.222.51.E5]
MNKGQKSAKQAFIEALHSVGGCYIDIDMLRTHICVIRNLPEALKIPEIKHCFTDEEIAEISAVLHTFEGFCAQTDSGFLFICLPFFERHCDDWTPKDYGTLAHEALHASVAVWNAVEANLVLPDNDEVLAYTQGYLVEQIIEASNFHYGD